ncbi:hypothetical protein AAV35_009390 [Salimicrobium jeotgali]|uniref:Ribosomal-protein-serine N-acetyltransferase n=1 Tax=Salimicrobium jeotgali TaxID=1230341 RepID=K2GBN4_9BACI|nr:GNAT family N-acetyltransferase [Salimicrobium jeotgali]AKG04994.1 hypothetical protein AAV35_009390 [Salimicrobium jeotgali]EKE31677.1 ribosomal-protein-serine N-acetyltransferase [Salimicrobium jeotgali]MBM7696499.1 ribosomal-protein-serine acetyltransferase [Salimicrobium jeotgali]
MFVRKVDEKTELRLVEFFDAGELFEIVEEERHYLQTWLPWVENTREVQDMENAIRNFRRGYAEYESMTAVVLFQGKIVGVVSFNELDWKNRTTYIGYWLRREYQGRGIITKSVKSLITFAFSSFGMNKVIIRASVANETSRAVAERLGFTKEGVSRSGAHMNNRFIDQIIYGILKKNGNKFANSLAIIYNLR